MIKKWVCSVCGYVHEGATPPQECPVCHVPASKFNEVKEEKVWAAEHVVGVAQGAPEEIVSGLRDMFNGECSEVGMYLAMSRVAIREGYPEIGAFFEKAAMEEAWQSRGRILSTQNRRRITRLFSSTTRQHSALTPISSAVSTNLFSSAKFKRTYF